jgi:hypothetical protein
MTEAKQELTAVLESLDMIKPAPINCSSDNCKFCRIPTADCPSYRRKSRTKGLKFAEFVSMIENLQQYRR